MLVDPESALSADEVIAFLTSIKVVTLVSPLYEGWMILTADQRIHSVEKRYFYHSIAGIGRMISPSQKWELWKAAVGKVTPDVVRGFWESNGLNGENVDVEKVAKKLFSEGQHVTKEYKEVHCRQLLSYLTWRREHSFDFEELKQRLPLLEGTSYYNTIVAYLRKIRDL